MKYEVENAETIKIPLLRKYPDQYGTAPPLPKITTLKAAIAEYDRANKAFSFREDNN